MQKALIKARVEKRMECVMQSYSVAKTLLNDAKLKDHWEGMTAAMSGKKIKFLEGYTSELGGYGSELQFLKELMDMLGEEDE